MQPKPATPQVVPLIDFHTREEKYENFYDLYCRFCEKVKLPKIWEENQDKLSKDMKIGNLMLKWNTLRTSWLQNDILGCIIPNNPSKV